jgi:hypothetical protein
MTMILPNRDGAAPRIDGFDPVGPLPSDTTTDTATQPETAGTDFAITNEQFWTNTDGMSIHQLDRPTLGGGTMRRRAQPMSDGGRLTRCPPIRTTP